MEAEDELAQLEALLAAEDVDHPAPRVLRDADLFSAAVDSPAQGNGAPSALHTGDTDSSDDEDKRNCLEPRYNEYGNDIKKLLNREEDEKRNRKVEFESRLRQANVDVKIQKKLKEIEQPSTPIPPIDPKYILCAPSSAAPPVKADVFTDPVFGIRITKPLISSSGLLDSMQGREAINLLRVKRHVEHGDLTKDWVLAGAIVRSSGTKKSQKGNQFVIWTLSDLRDDLKTVSLFLFRKAYSELWKTSVGTVVAVLNPSVLDKTEDRIDQASLSVDSPERLMILGQSKDYGICKSKKKNGEPCTSFVNLNQCEHCIYHVKQEYQKYSRRQELQSSTMGKGLVQPLQNKVLGKSTVIYGGRSYSALPVAKSQKVLKQDQNRLMTLSDYYKSENDLMINKSPYGGPIKKSAVTVNPTGSQRIKDLERLDKLHSSPSSSNISSNGAMSLADKVASSPKLSLSKTKIGFGLDCVGTIDLNVNYGQRAIERAKANAAKIIQQKGGIRKFDPHNLKGTESGKKRALEQFGKCGNDDENETKKPKVSKELDKIQLKGMMSERFKKILEATSAHQNLIEQHEDNEQEKYFGKLEKKEAMEEKMLNTFKLACKAVRCIKCKYTSFSAADRCKEERHPLKVFDSFKRFFKCSDCGNRTVSLELIPLHSCKNCRSSRWEKAPMMREKKGVSLADGLSIRGEEESHIGGQITSGKNINLLVPDSE